MGEVAELDVALDRLFAGGHGPSAAGRSLTPVPKLRLWDTDGYRHQETLTTRRVTSQRSSSAGAAYRRGELRSRRCAQSGLDRMPFAAFAMNQARLELVVAGTDPLAWLRTRLPEGELAGTEPKALHYRLLHLAAASSAGPRRLILRLPAHWP